MNFLISAQIAGSYQRLDDYSAAISLPCDGIVDGCTSAMHLDLSNNFERQTGIRLIGTLAGA